MRIIKTIKDIKLLRSALVVKKDILDEIEMIFNYIYNNLGEGISLEEFSLIDTGIIVLLEIGDNVTDLSEIGLNPEDGGLLGATPGWIRQEKLTNSTLIVTCIFCNNEYAVSIFFERSDFGEDVESWINENI